MKIVLLLILNIAIVVGVCGWADLWAHEGNELKITRAGAYKDLLSKTQRKGKVRIIVKVGDPLVPESLLHEKALPD